MNLIQIALRRPMTVMVAIVAIAIGCIWAVRRMDVDVFPALNLPVIYVAQPYGGMDPAQMEGLLTNYYEYHFLYITGIHHVESKNIQGLALMKLFFHPGTNMPQAMAETINYVNRSQAFMPPGTVSPFVMRFDTGSVPVGYLVLSSDTRTLAEIQDLALFRVRPMFATLAGCLGTAAVRRQSAHDRHQCRSRPLARLSYFARGSDCGSLDRQHGQPVRQRAHRRYVSDGAAQLDRESHRRVGQHSACTPAPGRSFICAIWPRFKTARTSRPATPWSMVAGQFICSAPSGPTPPPLTSSTK